MSAPRIIFYFDFISPWSYFAQLRLSRLAREGKLTLDMRPVVFGKLLDQWGQLGPAEIAPKREFIFKQAFRYAREKGIDLVGTKFHPFNPLLALRLALAEVSGDQQSRVIESLFHFGWGRGGDLGSESEICDELSRSGLDAATLVEKTRQLQIKEVLAYETQSAIQRGVFGVPSMLVGDELFWGNDSIDSMLLFIEGRDFLDTAAAADFLARPAAIHRKR